MALRFNIVSQQSMEQKAAKNSDAFTTVSDITAQECEQFLERKPDVLTINGINKPLRQDDAEFSTKRNAARKQILKIASTLCGEQLDGVEPDELTEKVSVKLKVQKAKIE